jgi:hypothetical protein
MSNDELVAIIENYARAHGLPPPPPITPDSVAQPSSIIDYILTLLGLAANTGDPADNTGAQTGYAERDAKTADAMAKFPANEEQSSAQLAGVGQEGQMAQQVPQMASGVAQAVSGALGGALQPLSQIPQQVGQVGQQAMQMGMGALQHGAGSAAAASEAVPGEVLGAGAGLGAAGADLAGAAGGAGAAGLGATAPTAMLGPPPAPSAGTVPMSSPSPPPVPPNAPEPAAAPRGGMGAMPMVPPGAMHGAGATGSDAKPDTKRVVPPSVKNGAPVQGRISAPPSTAEITKRVEGKPVASRRILLPDQKPDDDSADSSR